MSIQKFDYSVESVQKDKSENSEKKLESLTKLFTIKLIICSKTGFALKVP